MRHDCLHEDTKANQDAGLQEVTHWETAPFEQPEQLETVVDSLPVLLDALADHGMAYEAVAVNTNFSGSLPIDSTTLAKLTVHDVILARADLPAWQLKVSNPTSQNYEAFLSIPVGDEAIDVVRGWSTVDVRLRGKKFRFVNTHLEAFGQEVRTLQAKELADSLAESPYPVVLVGDLNALPEVPGDSYQLLLEEGYVDSWVEAMGDAPRLTAGQASDLMNVPSALENIVDYVLYSDDGAIRAVSGSGDIVGDELEDRTPSGLWPSDHAGVAVTLQISKPRRKGHR